MPSTSKPHAGQTWPPRAGEARSARSGRAPDRPAPTRLSESDLLQDLAVLVEQGLVVPVQDGHALRYAVAGDDA